VKLLNGDLLSHLPLLMSLHYMEKHIICILYLIIWPYRVQNIIKIGRWVSKI